MSVMLQPVSALFWPMMLHTACCTAFKPSMPSIAAGAAFILAGFMGDAPDMFVVIPVFIGIFIPPTPCTSNARSSLSTGAGLRMLLPVQTPLESA